MRSLSVRMRGKPMKAAFIERHGGPEVLKFGEMPDPVAAPGEVVVDIVAASVNGADWKVREGKSGQLSKFPYILGRDFSGVVSAVGKGVADFSVGDEVFAVCDVGQEGAYAEKIAIKAAIVARKTDRLSHVDAAALALAGLTAICTIEDALKLKADETILIQGGAGGDCRSFRANRLIEQGPWDGIGTFRRVRDCRVESSFCDQPEDGFRARQGQLLVH